MNDDMARRIKQLIDKDEIRDVLMDLCRGMDRRDAALLTSAFHPDARIQSGIPRKPGAEHPDWMTGAEIAGMLIGVANKAALTATHFVGNVKIELEGDVAFVESYALGWTAGLIEGKAQSAMRADRYVDRWEKRAGAWKIAERIVVNDWGRLDEIVTVAPHTALRPSGVFPTDPVYTMRAKK